MNTLSEDFDQNYQSLKDLFLLTAKHITVEEGENPHGVGRQDLPLSSSGMVWWLKYFHQGGDGRPQLLQNDLLY